MRFGISNWHAVASIELDARGLCDSAQLHRVVSDGLRELLGAAADHVPAHRSQLLRGFGQLEDAGDLDVELGDDGGVGMQASSANRPTPELDRLGIVNRVPSANDS
ncbi:hypothetical protein [Variovorax sp. J22R115]|uniref:hypothetical protein n=1 Tax=Variovorax sp. J22R115 TaxID=3053509 RepID=UPI0025777519|nr:hypothetical protein [Variovorax sp. J22R115]MDM0047500.1 hypothetical protein [Variovorax sp. J22R115]